MRAPTLHSIAALLTCLLVSPVLSQATDQGYTCDGSIIPKDSSTTDYSAANLICCKGDPDNSIRTGPQAPKSCTAGSAVPLTEAAKATGGSGSGGSGAGSTDSASVTTTGVAVASTNAAAAATAIIPLGDASAAAIAAAAVAAGIYLEL